MSPSSKPRRVPIYIVSKGRAAYMVTSRALTAMGVPHFVVVEPQQVQEYQEAVQRFRLNAEILEMDLTEKDRYELCDNLGLSRSTGPGPARNFAWRHAIESGAAWHWVMDDNIKAFYRYSRNLKVPVADGAIFLAMEDFAERYQNLAMLGPNYFMFVERKAKKPAFVANTRIYSCNLIRNDLTFRWRGRYNEDTILSLDILKAGWCTVLFNAFLAEKMETQKLPGGNTDEFYLVEGQKRDGAKYADTGTVAKSVMLAQVHPDVARVAIRFKRVHHHVDYRPFARQALIRKPDCPKYEGSNEYGMKLVTLQPQGGQEPI